MGKDLPNLRPAYLQMQDDLERLRRALSPSYVDFYRQVEQALAPIRQQHREIARAIELSEPTSSRLAEIVRANQRWQNMIKQATATAHVFEDLNRIHKTWLDAIKPAQNNLAQLQAVANLSLCDMTRRLTITEQLFSGLDLDSLRQAIALPNSVISNLEHVLRDVTSTYERLVDSIQTIPEVARLPMFSLSGATREIFTTGYALDAICVCEEFEVDDTDKIQLVAEVEQETSHCIALLQKVDPALARPYIGARDALHSRNADKIRHILASLRELWNHLLRRLAPDERVIEWLRGDNKELLHDGRPTRKARVLYVCRNLNHGPLTDFLVQDTRALVTLVEFFNRVHELNPKLTDEQLRALLLRTDSWLMYILQIWEGTR